MSREESVLLDLVKIALMLIFPPIGVYFFVGFGVQFWLNLLLTIFFYIPGLMHAIYIAIHPEMHKNRQIR